MSRIWNALKKTGIALFLFMLFIQSDIFASDIEIETVLKNKHLKMEQSTILSLKIKGASSSIKLMKIPEVKGLDIAYMGMQRTYRYVNGKSWRGVVVTFRIRAKKEGEFIIPPFVFQNRGKNFKSSPVKLKVSGKGNRERDSNDYLKKNKKGMISI